jgi:hypothetical protein
MAFLGIAVWVILGILGFGLKNYCYKKTVGFEYSLTEGTIFFLYYLSIILGPVSAIYALIKKFREPEYRELKWGLNFSIGYPKPV